MNQGIKTIQSLFFKKKNNLWTNFGENLTVIIGGEAQENSQLMKAFLNSFNLSDENIVSNLRDVTVYLLKLVHNLLCVKLDQYLGDL